jgi:hypothetical protein
LIELSIVLVIIGLLVGSVLTGRELIHASELRAVITQHDKIIASIRTFQAKYNCLPGDCKNAETFWASDASCPGTIANSVPKQATCNGNGDGFIGKYSVDLWESFRSWQQLANAGLIAGQYAGTYTPGNGYGDYTTNELSTPGVNVPAGPIAGSGFSMEYCPATDVCLGAAWWSGYDYQHVLWFGQFSQTGYVTNWPVVSAGDAFAIDQKSDDGLPGSGHLVSMTPGWAKQPNCASSSNPTTALYQASRTGTVDCTLVFNERF